MSMPKVINALLCDDVRIEKNGKHILVGVYTGDIVVTRAPIAINLVIWTQLEEISEEGAELELKGIFNANPIFEGGVEASPEQPKEIVTIRTPKIPLNIEDEGTLKISIRYKGDRWKEIISKKILVQGRREDV